MKVTNCYVYDLENAIKAGKYPMSTDISKLNAEVSKGIDNLALSSKGEGHDNFLSGIVVSFDLTCTNKMWVEFERYHFAQIVSSQSTMHRIARFDISESCISYVHPGIIEIVEQLKKEYNDDPTPEKYLKLLYSVPSGFELTARITTNYRQLKTMYAQRKDHRLPEWREFCKILEGLPHSEWITGVKKEEEKPSEA